MTEILLAMLVVTVLVGVYIWRSGTAQAQSIQSRLAKVPGFNASHQYVGVDGKSAVGIDDRKQVFCFITCDAGRTVHRLIPYASVISTEVHEDGSVVSSASRSSQILGAAAGGLAFGVVGAIAGAVTGKRTETPTVSRIDLRVMVNDMAKPTHSVNFLSFDVPRSGPIYSAASEQARTWQARFEAALRIAEAKPETAQQTEHS